MHHFLLKKIALFAALAMALTALAGCGDGDAGPSWEPGKPMEKDAITVGVIYIDKLDSGYSYAHDLGIVAAQEALGLRDDQIIRKIGVNDTDPVMIEHSITECVSEGANIIIATTWGYMDICERLAEAYPDVVFAHASGYKSNGRNFTNYYGRVYQTRYLSGVAAGLKTESGKVGYVAAQDKNNSEVTGGLNAFALGVASVNPGAEVYVSVTHSWYDPEGERQAARDLIAMGCDVITQHCDTAMPQEEAAASGVWGIGYNVDMSVSAPDTVLTSVVWNWGVYYTSLIGGVIDGTFTATPYYGGLSDGMVGLAPFTPALSSPEIEDAVGEARNRILAGFNVFDGELRTNDGRTVGTAGGTLTDNEITEAMNWYLYNITEV